MNEWMFNDTLAQKYIGYWVSNKCNLQKKLFFFQWMNECLTTPQHKNKLAVGCQTNRIYIKRFSFNEWKNV